MKQSLSKEYKHKDEKKSVKSMNDKRMPPKAVNQSYKDLRRIYLIPKFGQVNTSKSILFLSNQRFHITLKYGF